MNQRHTITPDPEEIIVSVDAVFTLRFRRDKERGASLVDCQELPEAAGYGKTLSSPRRCSTGNQGRSGGSCGR